jgi:hypothetical protein
MAVRVQLLQQDYTVWSTQIARLLSQRSVDPARQKQESTSMMVGDSRRLE